MKALYIDTSSNTHVRVGLIIDGKEDLVEKKLDYHKAQIVLPLIEKLLKKQKITLQDIDGIKVNPGPGSFTGVRVGVSIANALGFALDIPVNGKKDLVVPLYE